MGIDVSRLSEHAQRQIREAQAALMRERAERVTKGVVTPPSPLGRAARDMNSWEQDYAARLASDSTVAWFEYEPIKLRLAKNTGYTPDFIVVRTSGAIEAHEVKGFWRDDARVKIKVAAEKYSFIKFLVCRRLKGQWIIEDLL